MGFVATAKDIPFDVYFILKAEVLLKSRVRENFKHGSVRDVEPASMIEYCGTPLSKEGRNGENKLYLKKEIYDVYSTEYFAC